MNTKFAARLAIGALVVASTGLTACTPDAIQAALEAAKKAQGGTAVVPGIPGTPTATSSAAAKPAASSEATKKADEYFAKFKAKVDANAADPEKTLKLFIAAYAQYAKDATLSKELMTLFMEPREGGAADFGDVERDPISRSGLRFIAARNNYWRELDKKPSLVTIHLKNATDADAENPEDGVLIDFDYKAAEKGLNGIRYKQYLYVNDGSNKLSRPVLLQKVGERWKVKEFSSIMIQT